MCIVRSEPIQQAFEIFQLFFGAFPLPRTTPDLIQKLTCAAVYVFALQQVFVRPDLAIGASAAAQGITLLAGIGAFGQALLSLARLLLLRHRLTKVAHAFPQGLHCL